MNCEPQHRYQNQPWYVKLWRRRHQLSIPYVAWSIWRAQSPDSRCPGYCGCGLVHHRFTFGECISIAKGIACGRMNWVYDWE